MNIKKDGLPLLKVHPKGGKTHTCKGVHLMVRIRKEIFVEALL
jgi:hypothetical protein